MAVKIKLTRLGKIRNPQYRIAVADARTRRDGRAIEVIGRYHPKEEPSLIEIDSERAQYWLGVGAQPTEPVLKLLKITGDWQKFKGLPGAEGTLKVKPSPSRPSWSCSTPRWPQADGAPAAEATQPKKKKAPAKKAEEAAAAEALPTSPPARLPSEPAAEAAAAEPAAEPARRPPNEHRAVVDAVEHLVRGIVDNPDDVRVDMVTSRRGRTVEVHVHPDDLGKVIGRGGRTATALRTAGGRHRWPRHPRRRGGHRPVAPASDGARRRPGGQGARRHRRGRRGRSHRRSRRTVRARYTLRGRGSRDRGGRLHRASRSREHGGRLLLRLGASPTATPPRRCAARCSWSTPRSCRRSTNPTSSTTTSSRGCGCGRSTARKSARSPRCCTPPRGELLASRPDGGGEVLVPFVERDRADGVAADGVVEIDPPDGLLDLDELEVPCRANRRRHDLSRLPGAAAAVVAGQGDRRRPGRSRRARPARTGRTTCTAPSTTRPTAAAQAW